MKNTLYVIIAIMLVTTSCQKNTSDSNTTGNSANSAVKKNKIGLFGTTYTKHTFYPSDYVSEKQTDNTGYFSTLNFRASQSWATQGKDPNGASILNFGFNTKSNPLENQVPLPDDNTTKGGAEVAHWYAINHSTTESIYGKQLTIGGNFYIESDSTLGDGGWVRQAMIHESLWPGLNNDGFDPLIELSIKYYGIQVNYYTYTYANGVVTQVPNSFYVYNTVGSNNSICPDNSGLTVDLNVIITFGDNHSYNGNITVEGNVTDLATGKVNNVSVSKNVPTYPTVASGAPFPATSNILTSGGLYSAAPGKRSGQIGAYWLDDTYPN